MLHQGGGCLERVRCERAELETGGQLNVEPPGTAFVEGALLFSWKMPGEGRPGLALREGETPSDHERLSPLVRGAGFHSM